MAKHSWKAISAVLIGILAFELASCSLAMFSRPGGHGRVAVSLRIPPSVAGSSLPDALKKAFAPPASARFIHPNTRFITLSITTDNASNPIEASAAVEDGSDVVSITVPDVPVGERTVTVSLYAEDGETLLSRGTRTVSVEPGETANVSLSAVPITENVMTAGPYLDGIRGVRFDMADINAFSVYRIELSAAGPYALRCYNYGTMVHEPANFELYGPDGRRIATTTAGAGMSSADYCSLPAGTCYVAIRVPDTISGYFMELSLDADLRITVNARTVYVDPTLSVMDRQRAFSIQVNCGYDAEQPMSADFSEAEGGGTVTLTGINATTLSAYPGDDGLVSTSATPTNCSLAFTDALLGIPRPAEYFALPAQLRTFVYCNTTASYPLDSGASSFTNLRDAVHTSLVGTNDLTTDAGSPVIAISGDISITPELVMEPVLITNDVLVLGGFSADWSRPGGNGSSLITASMQDSVLYVALDAEGSLFDRVDILIPDVILNNPTGVVYAISLDGQTSFVDCDIQVGDITLNAYVDAGSRYAFLYVTAHPISFDRCRIKGGNINLSGGFDGFIDAIHDVGGAGNLVLSNSLISVGVYASEIGNVGQGSDGIYVGADTTSIYLVGSSVSAGMRDGALLGDIPIMRPIDIEGNSHPLYCFNSVLLAPTLMNPDSAFVYSIQPVSTISLYRMALGYIDVETTSKVISLNGVNTSVATWPGSIYAEENLSANVTALSFLSLDAASGDFLRLGEESHPNLLTSGRNMGNEMAYPPELGAFPASRFSVDLDGNPRTGDGTTGYSIGAYEYD